MPRQQDQHMADPRLLELATRIAEALERLAPPVAPPVALAAADAFVWHPAPPRLAPVPRVSRVAIDLLQGVDRQKQILLDNTLRFAAGLPANNAMLWGARGMGKSSLVKATACGGQPAHARQPGADRDPSRGHPHPARAAGRAARRGAALPDPVRRPVVRARGQRLQGAEVHPRGRHRGPPGQCAVLRHLEPPPPDAARHDRERAVDRDQPVRGDRGEGLAVRPLRPVDRLSQLRPGRRSSP